MTGGPNRSLEELLRDRLHEVDRIEPPDPDFEFRALRAGRERLKERQSWKRGLLGLAAAVVIGALAIPALGRLNIGVGGASSSGGGAAAGSALSAPSAPEAATSGNAQDLAKGGAAPDGSSLDNVPDQYRATVSRLRVTLAAPPYDTVFTALTFDPSVPPQGRVVLHLTTPDPAAINLVQSTFAGGPEVVVETSAFTLASCNQTWTALTVDPQLRPDTVTITILGCDANGRVAVRVTPDVPPAPLARLQSYGDAVDVVRG